MTENKHADSLGSAVFDDLVRIQEHRKAPDQTELPFMCLKCGQEEAAKHPGPDGKYVKVQCVHKRVPRIIE